MAWLQIQIDCTREQVEALEDALLQAGALSVTLQDSADQPIFEPALGETPLWQNTQVVALFDADTHTAAVERSLPLADRQRWQWQTVDDKDWEREWMQDYQPIHCGNNLWVCPSWFSPPDAGAVTVLLDPGLAFGTGTHPTTFLCLKWLSGHPLKDLRVLDYGCGSGILAIAAAKLGASHVYGVDIDPQALLATRENARRNHLGDIAVYLPGDEPEDAQADLVLANILAGPLVSLAPQLIGKMATGGYICLSGLLHEQCDAVRAAYAAEVEFVAEHTHQGWACLIGRKHV